ncbi:NAD(P)-dependent oxidoreductase [Solirubrobacter ginsenosidimutans]|uniref:NAD(P)-dependent oxidoreductase n=1 Tax=Solirubrobacter ginsenosidimutans TaxID=490573 RepID=A0A9X3MLX1_9ACTN|nr:NAD(P)-dependent oxidoreductase [Solirubrobacter ginsenosidimutans]MDA0158634.1 NAD(P)-dependent oxidoreductase [Solirubrobacter ginsenosidimutans]
MGGSGKLGSACIDALLEDGWTVFNFDLSPPREPKCRFTRLDLTDYGQVVEAFAGIDELHDGVDAVVHLAAIPGATHAGNAATFVNNITATYHVFQAVKPLKIHNVVWASSETLLGYPFNRPPVYVPLDEDVPKLPEVAYSLVKDLEEEMAVQFCRWDPGQKLIGLRFSNVMSPDDYADFAAFENDPASRKWNLWSYIDARDGAQAVVQALAYDRPGFEAFLIAADDTAMSTPSLQLMDVFFPGVEVRSEIEGTAALCSIAKARRLLGFTPRHRWRDHVPTPPTAS